jgi:hypothetical protein
MGRSQITDCLSSSLGMYLRTMLWGAAVVRRLFIGSRDSTRSCRDTELRRGLSRSLQHQSLVLCETIVKYCQH